MKRALLVASIAFAAACGGREQGDSAADASPTHDSGVDTFIDFDTFTPPDTGVVGDDAGCTRDPTSLSALFTGRSCTVVVRVDNPKKNIVGWSIVCGEPTSASEADARAAFAPHVAPYTKMDEYVTVGGSAPPDEYVFYRSPGDFGGVGFVSAVRGDVVFAAELVWMGPTTVDFPSMRASHELDGYCTGFPKEMGLAPRRELIVGGGAISDELPLIMSRLDLSLLAPAITRAGEAIVDMLITNLPLGEGSTTPSNDWLVFVNTALILD